MRNYIKKDGKKNYLIFEAKESAGIDTVAGGMLENNDISGMLSFSLSHFNDTVSAKYDITSLKSLSEVLENTMEKSEIISLINKVIDVYEETENYMIKSESVILDPEFIFYDEEKKILHLIAEPFVNERVSTNDLKGFLKEFICRVKFDSSENCDYIGRLLGLLNSCEDPDTTEIKKLLTPEEESIALIKPDEVPVIVKSDDKVSHNFMSELDSFADSDDEEICAKEPKKSFISRLFGEIPKISRNESKDSMSNEDELMAKFGGRKNVLLSEEGTEETILLKNNNEKKKPCLKRKSSGEYVEIRGRRFRIGSEKKSVDYCINNNNAVSRLHAEIIRKNGSYYITDNNSTNHTYVNDKKLAGKKDCILKEGSVIKLADEEFTFEYKNI